MLIRSLPLFNNPLFTNKNKIPLKGATWLQYTKRGICRLADIIFYDHLGSREEIFQYYGWRPPKRSYRILRKSIPRPIKNAIASNPLKPLPNTQFGYRMDGTTHKLLFVTRVETNGYWANTFEVEEPFEEQEVRHLGSQFHEDFSAPRPIETKFSEDGILTSIQYHDICPILPQYIVLGDDGIKPPTKTKELRTLLSPSPQTPKNQNKWPMVNWKVVYSKFWKAPVPKKWSVTNWLLLTRSLYLGEKAAKHNWDVIPHNCNYCNTLETHLHLFLDCTVAKELWKFMEAFWSRLTQKNVKINAKHLAEAGSIVPTRFPKSNQWLPIWQALMRITVFVLWKTRCEEVFSDNPRSPLSSLLTLKTVLKQLITYHHNSLKFNKLIPLWTLNKIHCYLNPDNTIVFNF